MPSCLGTDTLVRTEGFASLCSLGLPRACRGGKGSVPSAPKTLAPEDRREEVLREPHRPLLPPGGWASLGAPPSLPEAQCFQPRAALSVPTDGHVVSALAPHLLSSLSLAPLARTMGSH